jgi:hypothetical protein
MLGVLLATLKEKEWALLLALQRGDLLGDSLEVVLAQHLGEEWVHLWEPHLEHLLAKRWVRQ